MVGVAGRSKGCHACRKKKIACSQEQPGCLICHRAGRVCPGYKRDVTFIEVVPSRSIKNASFDNLRTQRDVEEVQSRPRNFKFKHQFVSSSSVRSPAGHIGDQNTTLWKPPVCGPPVPAADRNLLAGAYGQQVVDVVVGREHIDSWVDSRSLLLVEVAHRSSASRELQNAIQVLCTARFSRIASNVELAKESRRLYGGGLHALQKALWSSQPLQDDTLAACILLALFEIYGCPSESRRGYKSHHDGCAAVLLSRGPKAHIEGLGHAAFIYFRTMAALEGLVNKKSPFSDTAWMTIPYSAIPRQPFDQLVDLIFETIPILSLVSDMIDHETTSLQYTKTQELLDLGWSLDARYETFYSNLVRSSPGLLFWPNSFPREKGDIIDPAIPEFFTETFAFQDIKVAHTLMHYWALRAMLLAIISHCYDLLLGHGTITSNLTRPTTDIGFNLTTTDLPLMQRAQDFPLFITYVCQSVEFCFRDRSTDLGPVAAMAPLRIVLDVLRTRAGFVLELKWIKNALSRVQKSGMGIAPFLSDRPPNAH